MQDGFNKRIVVEKFHYEKRTKKKKKKNSERIRRDIVYS